MTDNAEGSGPVLDAGVFIAANAEWVRDFSWGGLAVRPSRQMTILTCMDSRYTAQGVLGVALGEAHVIRNAGGRATDDAIRSLVLSAHALGTRGCVLIHHTNCGLHNTTNEAIRKRVTEATGEDASHIDFLPFADVAESVREDVAALRACPLLPVDYQVLGFVYDVTTGQLELIEA